MCVPVVQRVRTGCTTSPYLWTNKCAFLCQQMRIFLQTNAHFLTTRYAEEWRHPGRDLRPGPGRRWPPPCVFAAEPAGFHWPARKLPATPVRLMEGVLPRSVRTRYIMTGEAVARRATRVMIFLQNRRPESQTCTKYVQVRSIKVGWITTQPDK